MNREIKVGKYYRHFKGHQYKVIAIGFDTESYQEEKPDESKMVVYQDVNSGVCWVRPYAMFNSLVDRDKYPDIEQEYRFEEVPLTMDLENEQTETLLKIKK